MKATQLLGGAASVALALASASNGLRFRAVTTEDGIDSYWRLGSRSSLEFSDAVLAESVDPKDSTPRSVRKGPMTSGERFICDLHVDHAAPDDVVSVSVLNDSGEAIITEPYSIPEDKAGRPRWLTYGGIIRKPGRYTCRFTHGDLIREVSFEVADPASASNASPAHPCGS